LLWQFTLLQILHPQQTLNSASSPDTCKCDTYVKPWLSNLQKWNGLFFEKVTLKSLGLRIQLGHGNSICSLPQLAFNDDFVIIDADGIHEVGLDYCGCQQSALKMAQLLRSRLFPSTIIDPKTVATFRVLESFQMLNFTSKMSAYEFYQALARRTDNTGTSSPPVIVFPYFRFISHWVFLL